MTYKGKLLLLLVSFLSSSIDISYALYRLLSLANIPCHIIISNGSCMYWMRGERGPEVRGGYVNILHTLYTELNHRSSYMFTIHHTQYQYYLKSEIFSVLPKLCPRDAGRIPGCCIFFCVSVRDPVVLGTVLGISLIFPPFSLRTPTRFFISLVYPVDNFDSQRSPNMSLTKILPFNTSKGTG